MTWTRRRFLSFGLTAFSVVVTAGWLTRIYRRRDSALPLFDLYFDAPLIAVVAYHSLKLTLTQTALQELIVALNSTLQMLPETERLKLRLLFDLMHSSLARLALLGRFSPLQEKDTELWHELLSSSVAQKSQTVISLQTLIRVVWSQTPSGRALL